MRDLIKHKHGFGSKRIYFCFKSFIPAHVQCLIAVLAFFLIPPLSAQSEVQGSSSFVFQNEKLSSVLIKLSETGNLNFSYDANDPVYDKRISYSAEGEITQKMLDDILLNTGLTHKLIGNQIVLYHTEDEHLLTDVDESEIQDDNSNLEIITAVPGASINIDYQIDTIYLQDTILLHDTVYRIDTVKVIDTVFIKQEKPKKPASGKIKEIPVDFFQPGLERDKGWAMGIFVAPLLDDFSLVNGQKSFSLRSFSLGIDAIKLLKRWNITFGLRLTQFNQRYTQQYSMNEGGFYNTDTIDAYYTVVDIDTAWYYVTDSSWIPIEIREYNYQRTNTLGYLEFNLSASFDLYKSPKARIYLKAGGQISLLIYNNGIAIPGENQANGINFDDLQFNTVNYSFLLGAGLKYKIADRIDLNTELYYSRYLNALVPDFPFDTQINAFGLKVGLVFYF